MNPIVENLTGTAAMTDQVVTADLLVSIKTGVRTYAIALTETTSPDVRAVLRRHLDDAIHAHEQVSNYMMEKGWYHAHDVSKQIQLDMQNANTALGLQ
ncbi:spore coat protein [Alicyclobacillus suci]|uniref:spore coat protein n=1 Tax=Alicyclobacillus suci TaxID=2816080 RepID=UPI001A8F6F80|nr:spore coat protein [Alicyclobacillus suci]